VLFAWEVLPTLLSHTNDATMMTTDRQSATSGFVTLTA